MGDQPDGGIVVCNEWGSMMASGIDSGLFNFPQDPSFPVCDPTEEVGFGGPLPAVEVWTSGSAIKIKQGDQAIYISTKCVWELAEELADLDMRED